MGSFTKKYIRAFHPEDSLHLSWDVGYKNVAIYDGKRLVKQFEQAGQFTRGVSFQDEKLGKIKLKFTDTKPLQLELKVNGKKYKPSKKGKQDVDLSGVIAVFWAMMAFTAIVLIIGVTMSVSMNNILGNAQGIGILAGITGVYLFSALTMSFKKYWGFFIGFGWMTLSSGWYLFIVTESDMNFFSALFLLIRLTLLTYLILNIRKVLFAMNNAEKKKDESIIDEAL